MKSECLSPCIELDAECIYDGDLNEQGGLQIVLTVRLTSYLYFVTVDAQNTKHTAATDRYSIS